MKKANHAYFAKQAKKGKPLFSFSGFDSLPKFWPVAVVLVAVAGLLLVGGKRK